MIQFYVCDAVEGMDSLPEDSVDCMVTSPHYNIGTRYNTCDDRADREQYLLFTAMWAQAAKRILNPKGSLFLNIAGKPSDPWVPFEVVNTFRSAGWFLQNVIHWVKSISVDGETHGHFKPINSDRFLNNCHEYIFHFTHEGTVNLDRTAIGVRYQDESNLRRWAGAIRKRVHCRGDCWHMPYVTRRVKLYHPATFPEQLVENCLLLHGLPPKGLREQFQVVDPFMGSGTTATVAAKLGLSCTGFDIDAEYLASASARVEAQHGIQCSLSNGTPDRLLQE